MASETPKYEVSDSTDWLNTPLEPFAPVDAALRCQVCKEFYKTPMITSCSHTFCSLCIRRCLANDGKCPACRAPEQEIKLRNNWVVEDIVDAFAHARPAVLEYARQPPTVSNLRSSKRKASDVLTSDEPLPLKRTRSSSRRNPTVTIPINNFDDGRVDDEDDSFKPEDDDDGLVACPICQARMKEDRVNGHLDSGCLTEPPRNARPLHTKAQPVLQSHTNLTKPLAAVSYSILKDNALRKKLNDQGLSASGNRQLLERRYTEWVTLWNANCDSSKPRSKRDLLRELEAWERTTTINTLSSGTATNLGNRIRSKDFDGAEWQATHGDDFRDLIAKAKAQLKPTSSAKEPMVGPVAIAERPCSPSSIPKNISDHDQDQDSITGTKSQYFESGGSVQETQRSDPLPRSSMSSRPVSSSPYPDQHIPLSSQPMAYTREQPLSSKQPDASSLISQHNSIQDPSGFIVDGVPNR